MARSIRRLLPARAQVVTCHVNGSATQLPSKAGQIRANRADEGMLWLMNLS
jgi:hypothetical protein